MHSPELAYTSRSYFILTGHDKVSGLLKDTRKNCPMVLAVLQLGVKKQVTSRRMHAFLVSGSSTQ